MHWVYVRKCHLCCVTIPKQFAVKTMVEDEEEADFKKYTLRPRYSVIRVQGSLEACADFIELKARRGPGMYPKSHTSLPNT